MEAAEYDLIIVGAGPAGSACAITAGRAGANDSQVSGGDTGGRDVSDHAGPLC